MRAFKQCLALLPASIMLASCGGGGGSGSDGAFQPTPSGTLVATPSVIELPVNRDGVGPFFGSPYMGEVNVAWRRANGDLVSGTDVNVSIAPTTIASFSMLDDPTTPWIGQTKTPPTAEGNEFLTLMGSAPVHTTGGHATIFVHADDQTGTAMLTITAKDPASPTTISTTVPIRIVSGTPPLPASITITTSPGAVYLANSGGTSTNQLTVRVADGNGANIPNPGSGNGAVNNVQLEVLGQAGSGTITAVDASGASHTGNLIKTRTIQGIAGATFTAGSIQGAIVVRATSDAADNNVDNGITTPIAITKNIVVSDGKLYSVKLTIPTLAAIIANSVTNELDSCIDPQPPSECEGTYSLTVTAEAQDRQGNPALPGTLIRFGSIDSPVGEYDAGALAGQFLISGGDGNPQEGGNMFTAPTGRFRTAGGGAGPGDALLVFGKDVTGNADLESAVTIQTIINETTAATTSPFNLNNTTGTSVNYGSVLPYIMGRSMHGNIGATAQVDQHGAATVRLNYPITSLGRPVAIWAEGESIDPLTGTTRRATDVETLRYPGIADAAVTVSPNPILGNRPQQVTICVVDALEAPIQMLPVGFRFQLTGGTGTVDGNTSPGYLDSLTGPDGCAVANVVTQNVPASNDQTTGSGTVTFTVAGISRSVTIVVNVATLQVSPANVTVNNNPENATITIRALDDQGAGLPGVQINGSCTASGGAGASLTVTPTSGTTNSSGVLTVVATATGFGATTAGGAPGQGVCTFTTTSGLTGSVRFNGVACDDFSPPTCP
ncbi:hypothetical protein [Tahibacter amnicola]|uniref:Big-1 domain-containing protein n=1 Tax=Tahibacter amnicola TaxID=2976241 RepID=A0ABY6BE61_9GAMM|nr:hypothetical protein [Tahibacter amnicola]UXI67876.1 hypothetical protein N4264_24615 [Tahibacter amnicola]